jgi:hypothetical protein
MLLTTAMLKLAMTAALEMVVTTAEMTVEDINRAYIQKLCRTYGCKALASNTRLSRGVIVLHGGLCRLFLEFPVGVPTTCTVNV